MSNYALQPDKNTAVAISGYLEKLLDHPDCDSVLLAKVVKQLSGQWQQTLESNYRSDQFIHNEKIHT